MTVGQKTAELNLNLITTKNLPAQLSSAEWMQSIPGAPEQKDLLYRCIMCHTALPIVSSTYDSAGWLTTINRMRNWGPASEIQKPEILPFHQPQRPGDEKLAEYLSSINLSTKSKWDYELKTDPRPKGDATKVIITEYDLPRPDAQPHDAVIDSDGMVWYIDFGEPVLGRLNPKTGEIKEWTLPNVNDKLPGGSLDVELDKEGNPWIGRLLQSCLTRFDKKTEKMTNYSLPPEYWTAKSRTPFVAFGPGDKVWFADTWNRSMNLLDPATGHVDHYNAYPGWTVPQIDMSSGAKGNETHGHFIYGINADSKGMGYFADMAGGNIGVIDPETGKTSLYPTPSFNSGPRRMHVDSQDRLWFAENFALKVGLFDPKTKQFKEWADPTLWDAPYDAVEDREGYV
ncbi:MAG: hypothetical protein ACRD4Y_05105, partial [Candidatus Acidiferrales bacterium]